MAETNTQRDSSQALGRVLSKVGVRSYRKVLSHRDSFALFRSLDSEIFQLSNGDSTSLAVVSAQPKEGRTTIALLLATHAAALDPEKKVLFIDGHLGQPRASSLLGVPTDRPGLHHYMDRSAELEAVIHPGPLDNLWVLPGSAPPGAPLHFGHDRMVDLMDATAKRYDLIVVDTPSARQGKDFASLAKVVRNVILVVQYRGPNREQVRMMMSDLDRVNARVLGAVMNHRIYPAPRFFYAIG